MVFGSWVHHRRFEHVASRHGAPMRQTAEVVPATSGDVEPVPDAPHLGRRLALVVLPLGALIVMFAVFLASDPLDGFRTAPPRAAATAERVVFEAEPPAIRLAVRNAGTQPLTVSQIIVNDGYWQYTIGDRQLGRFESTHLEILYPWEE